MLFGNLLDLTVFNTSSKVVYLLLRVLLIPLLLSLLTTISRSNTAIANILHDLQVNIID